MIKITSTKHVLPSPPSTSLVGVGNLRNWDFEIVSNLGFSISKLRA